MMKPNDQYDDTKDLELDGDLFPVFRKAKAVTELLSGNAVPSTGQPGSARDDLRDRADHEETLNNKMSSSDAEMYMEEPTGSFEESGEAHYKAVTDEKENKTGNAEEERIPAIFGDVCLDKYKVQEVTEHEPTLLEFLNELSDDLPPLPVPSLFEGIGRDYYVSDEIMRLAAEAEAAEERERESAAAEDDSAEEQPEEESAPDAAELFDLIYNISQQQEDEINRQQYENQMRSIKRRDPYNTVFNDRETVINYDNVEELPMEEKYILTTVESEAKPDKRKRERTKERGKRRHFQIYK